MIKIQGNRNKKKKKKRQKREKQSIHIILQTMLMYTQLQSHHKRMYFHVIFETHNFIYFFIIEIISDKFPLINIIKSDCSADCFRLCFCFPY